MRSKDREMEVFVQCRLPSGLRMRQCKCWNNGGFNEI